MKLAKIDHYRCGDYDSTLYVVIPDDMTVDQLDELVSLASDKAIEAERVGQGVAPVYPRRDILIQTMPKTSTLAEVDSAFEEQKHEYDAFQKKKDEARRSFYSWLGEVSGDRIMAVHDYDFGDFEVSCSWGHNHGVSLDYAEDGL
jgi:endonuclease YncB( thermonuclease family)